MDNFNRVILCGQVKDTPALSHINHAVSFYKFTLDVPRLSGQSDFLTVIVTAEQLGQTPLAPGDTVTVTCAGTTLNETVFVPLTFPVPVTVTE